MNSLEATVNPPLDANEQRAADVAETALSIPPQSTSAELIRCLNALWDRANSHGRLHQARLVSALVRTHRAAS